MTPSLFSNIRVRRALYRVTLFSGDAFLMALSFYMAYLTRFYFPPFLDVFPITKGLPSWDIYAPLQLTAVGIWMASFFVARFYDRVNLHSWDEFLRIVRGVALGWIVILAGTFLYRRMDYSRIVLILSAFYACGLMFFFRAVVKWFYIHVAVRWWEPHSVLVIGHGRMSRSILRVLGWHPEIDIIHKTIRDPGELKRFLAENAIREVFVGEPDIDHATLVAMSDACGEEGISLRIVPDILELRMGEIIFDDSLGLPTYTVKPLSLHGWTYVYKRLFDVLVSTVILSLAFFPLLFVAVMIRVDSRGPVIFRQPRLGHRRRPFPFFKFRTMVANADDYLEKLKALSERRGPVFKMKNDPRVTRIGKWLRKFSLDEVPQILNVLMGHMSLVGPRPQVLWEAAAYDDWAKKRLNVFPGITGLWQVSGRAHLSYEQMIDLDIYYIEHWSPGLDLKILLQTIPTILRGQGAY